jgi:two-component system, OmpR family, KDP operon response regulator KdpE
MSRILVVDDEPQILRALRINLKARGYDVEMAATGVEALSAAARRLPDAVLLDLGLPDMDGIEVLLGLRGWTTVPVVVLSGRVDASDKIGALDAGADDYVTKPFAMDELLARLRAVLRRHQTQGVASAVAEPAIILGQCRIDLSAHTVVRQAVPDGVDVESEGAESEGAESGGGVAGAVHLTRTEWSLLEVLLRHPRQLVSTHQLLTEVWGAEYRREAGYLRFHMARLRRKLEPDPLAPRYLVTEYGLGYRFVP